MHKVRESNYNCCTGRSSENICSSDGGGVEALKKKETEDETHCTIKIGGKTSLGPIYFVL
jgi:hypothetical protein